MKRIAALFLVAALCAAPSFAAVTDSGVSTSAKFIKRTAIFPLRGQFITANTPYTGVVQWVTTEDIKILGVKATCRTHNSPTTLTVDFLDDGVSVLDSTIDLKGTVLTTTAATITGTPSVASGSVMRFTVTITGGGKTADDITAQVTYRTKAGTE